MYAGTISTRYAKALMAFAKEVGAGYAVYQEAITLEQNFRLIPELYHA